MCIQKQTIACAIISKLVNQFWCRAYILVAGGNMNIIIELMR